MAGSAVEYGIAIPAVVVSARVQRCKHSTLSLRLTTDPLPADPVPSRTLCVRGGFNQLDRRYIRWCGAQDCTGFGHAVASFAETAGHAMMTAMKLEIDIPRPCESVAATLPPSSHASDHPEAVSEILVGQRIQRFCENTLASRTVPHPRH